eukprot:12891308-Prorocentrum_lima.AAC.1
MALRYMREPSLLPSSSCKGILLQPSCKSHKCCWNTSNLPLALLRYAHSRKVCGWQYPSHCPRECNGWSGNQN